MRSQDAADQGMKDNYPILRTVRPSLLDLLNILSTY